jgi:hypothetical protein
MGIFRTTNTSLMDRDQFGCPKMKDYIDLQYWVTDSSHISQTHFSCMKFDMSLHQRYDAPVSKLISPTGEV